MHLRRLLAGLVAAGGLLATSSLAEIPAAGAAGALAPGVTAFYEMNEPAGTTVMHDSGPNGLDGVVDPTGVQSGFVLDGATAYNWVRRPPEQPPASPERVIQVPDNVNLEPGTSPFTIEIRYRTKENFGNIIQKGQAQSQGGQWKIQAPSGIPSCLFKGSTGQVGTGAKTPLNDDQWHDLTCVLTSSGVSLYVDGAFRSRKTGSAGRIDNRIPMTIGGKINCDQVLVTCDYFSGQIDFVKITKAANLLPSAAFTASCIGLTCSFDSSTAADADGSLTSTAWNFGDGSPTSNRANPSHIFAQPGTYTVRLTVIDNQGATDVETHTLVVEAAPPTQSPVAYVGSAVATGNNSSPTVTVPAAAAAGDRLLMILSYNNLSRTVSEPTGVTGWTRLDSVAAGTMGAVAWTKVVQPGDPGAAVVVSLGGLTKHTTTVAAYRGVQTDRELTFARATDVSTASARLTPVVSAPLGSWVASYWSDKSGTTNAWAPSGSVTSRGTGCGADAGHICSALADSGGPLPAASYGNVEATTNAPSSMATMWSFVLAPAPEAGAAT